MRYRGSYLNGFAPRDFEPAYPELWRGCVGAWCPSLGPTGGVLRDWSGRQNHGTLTDTTLDTVWSNQQGYCLWLDGINDKVTLPSTITTGTTFTMSMWVKPNSPVTAYECLFGGAAGNVGLFLQGSAVGANALKMAYYDPTGVDMSTGALTDQVWNHVCLTCSAGALTFYINAIAAGTGTSVGSISFGLFGGDSAGQFLLAGIDDIRFLSETALSLSQVRDLYSNGRGRGIAYSFNQPRGSLTPGDSGSSGDTFPGLAWRALRRWRFVVRAGVDGNWPRVT